MIWVLDMGSYVCVMTMPLCVRPPSHLAPSIVLQVTSLMLMPHADAFSVFATDGVWGFVGDQEVVDAVNKVLAEVRGGGEGGEW
jgi:hypothetical protein